MSAAAATTTLKAGWKIRMADGSAQEIPRGAFYMNTKARAKRRMLIKQLSSKGRAVDACLELHTMGFSQEEAVTMEDGKKRHLRMSDIARETGLKRQHVDEGYKEVESLGLAARRSDDDGPRRKGHTRLYAFAEPREPQNCNRARGTNSQFPHWFPPEWKPLKALAKRLKIDLSNISEVPARGYIELGNEAARKYEEALNVAARFLEELRAHSENAALNKEERTERTSERTSSSASSPDTEQQPEATTTAPPPRSQPRPTQYAVPAPERERLAVIESAVAEYVPEAPDVARQIDAGVRKEDPEAAPEEIAGVVREKGELLRSGRYRAMNPAGFLVTAVVRAFRLRREPQPSAAPPPSPDPAELERKRREWQAVLDDPAAGEDEKSRARLCLGIDEPAAQAQKAGQR